jgi:hypothetical protein
MSKILKSLVGLVVVGAAIGLSATPTKATPVKIPAKPISVKAESKASQCKSFKKSLVSYYQKMGASFTDDVWGDGDFNTGFARMRQANSKNRQQFQSIKFGDPKILKIRQSILDAATEWDKGVIEISKAQNEEEVSLILLAMGVKQLGFASPAYEYCQWPRSENFKIL